MCRTAKQPNKTFGHISASTFLAPYLHQLIQNNHVGTAPYNCVIWDEFNEYY